MRLDHITPKQTVMWHNYRRRIATKFVRLRVSRTTSLPGGISERVPPESISNSVVKTLSADDSAGFPRVKVGHCQAYTHEPPVHKYRGFVLLALVLLQTIDSQDTN